MRAQSIENTGVINRRDLLILGWGGLMFHFTLAGLASLRYLVPNVLYEPLRVFKLRKPEDYPDNALTFVEEQKIYIVKAGGSAIRAVSAVCSHLGCTVNWSEPSGHFLCPCHGSKFDARGKNIAGPAPLPLQWFQVSLGRDGRIIVDLDKVVRPEMALKT